MEFIQEIIDQKIKDSVYIINRDEYAEVGTHWIDLAGKNDEIVNFDSFRV